MKHKKVFDMVLFSTFSAIILILTLVPNIGYIRVGVASITIVHIPVLIGIMFLGLGYSLSLGLVFGLSSLIAAFMYASSPADLAFQNPIISVLPRIVFALVAFYIIRLLFMIRKKSKYGNLINFIIVTVVSTAFILFASEGIVTVTNWYRSIVYPVGILLLVVLLTGYIFFIRKSKHKNLAYVPAAFIVSTLIHTVLVLGTLGLMKPAAFGDNADIFGIILSVLGTNGVIEAAAGVLIGTPIVVALKNLIEKDELDESLI